MKLILTGAAGFIGSCFLRKLNDMGIDHVFIVDTHPSADGIRNLRGKKFKDYLSREDLLERLKNGQLDQVDGIVHLGACADTTEMDRLFLKKNNLEYSQTLASWAQVKRKFFHYASSASVYGDGKQGYSDDPNDLSNYSPLNPYAESKWLFDQWIIDQNLISKMVGYRYFNVFGPNEYHKGDMRSMVNKAYDQIQSTGKARLFGTTRDKYADGTEERDFVYVKDVVDVMAFFLTHPYKGGIFNIGTGKARYFRDLVSAVFAALGKTPDIEYFPMPEKLRNQYQYFTEADIGRLSQVGYNKPFMRLEDSVADYVKTHLSQPNPYY